MDTHRSTKSSKFYFRLAASIAGFAGLLLTSSWASAQEPLSMAPPVDGAYTQSYDTSSASADTVFGWSEIPQNQQVPISRAVFDQGGYQLFDTVGETIVVPFTDNNLYVMKFARSDNGTMYFVNDGDVPILYVPQNGYLENASVSGARWYPFSADFCPQTPVYCGVAPSWNVFISMGWYPGMYCHGGYWCATSFWDGGFFTPAVGLFFVIGGHPCYGWHDYDDYCAYHPAPCHIAFHNYNVYRVVNEPRFGNHPFGGIRSWSGNQGNGGHSWSGNQGNGGHSWNGNQGNTSHGQVFNGSQGSSQGRSFSGGQSWNGNGGHSFQGTGASNEQSRVLDSGRATYGGPDRVFRGDANYGGNVQANDGGHNYGAPTGERSYGGDRSFGGGQGSYNAPSRVFQGGSTNNNGSASDSGHSYGGSSTGWSDRSAGGSRSYGDNQSSSGSHSYNSGSSSRSSDNHDSHISGGSSNGGGSSNNTGGGHWGH